MKSINKIKMPALEIMNNGPVESAEDVGPINPVVGIIYPPPEVRSILFYNKYFLFFTFKI